MKKICTDQFESSLVQRISEIKINNLPAKLAGSCIKLPTEVQLHDSSRSREQLLDLLRVMRLNHIPFDFQCRR